MLTHLSLLVINRTATIQMTSCERSRPRQRAGRILLHRSNLQPGRSPAAFACYDSKKKKRQMDTFLFGSRERANDGRSSDDSQRRLVHKLLSVRTEMAVLYVDGWKRQHNRTRGSFKGHKPRLIGFSRPRWMTLMYDKIVCVHLFS